MDRISKFPDEILCHIISFLPTKYAVGTSILSKRWSNLWVSVPVLDFDNRQYLNPERMRNNEEGSNLLFMGFVDKVFALNHSPKIIKFRLKFAGILDHSLSRIVGWIKTVIMRNVVELDLCIFPHFHIGYGDYSLLYLFPPTCESLLAFKINGFNRLGLHLPTWSCFPNLRILDARIALYERNYKITKRLFPSLPLLEKLTLCVDIRDVDTDIDFNITGTVLKSLDMEIHAKRCDVKVVIDAPYLEFLQLKDRFVASYLVKNQPAIREVKLDIGCYSKEYYMDNGGAGFTNYPIELLRGLCNTKSMSISSCTTLALLFALNKNLPAFCSLAKLELNLYPGCWNLFLNWLESCPNLKSLILTREVYRKDIDLRGVASWRAPEFMPTCLLFHLKKVEIKKLGEQEENRVLKYLRKNAKVLENFTVDSRKNGKMRRLHQ